MQGINQTFILIDFCGEFHKPSNKNKADPRTA